MGLLEPRITAAALVHRGRLQPALMQVLPEALHRQLVAQMRLAAEIKPHEGEKGWKAAPRSAEYAPGSV